MTVWGTVNGYNELHLCLRLGDFEIHGQMTFIYLYIQNLIVS